MNTVIADYLYDLSHRLMTGTDELDEVRLSALAGFIRYFDEKKEPLYYTISGLQKRLSVTTLTIRNWMYLEGWALPFEKREDGKIKIKTCDLFAWMLKHKPSLIPIMWDNK